MQGQFTVAEKEQLVKLAKSRGLQGKPASLSPLSRAERGAEAVLSYAQQRMWFLAQMEGVSQTYHIFYGYRLRGELNAGALRRALNRIVERHEALRTVFVTVEGEAKQRILAPAESRFQLREYDVRGHAEATREVDRMITEEVSTVFDLERGPLIRGRLIWEGEKEHALLITMHHVVSDGWSMNVFLKELSELYGAFGRGEEDPLEELELQYADYAVWQRKWMGGEVLEGQAEYWKRTLAGAPGLLELPSDHARPKQQSYAGGWVSVVLEEELTEKLKELSRRHGVTLFMTLLAGWAALLARLSGEQDIVIGTPTANRGRQEVEGLIGFFVNTLALRLDVTGSQTVEELLARVKQQALAAQQHQDLPFEQVVEMVRPVRSLGHSPVFQVMFSWENSRQDGLELSGLEVERLRPESDMVATFDLTLVLGQEGRKITGGVEYARSLYEAETMARWMGHFRTLLRGMVEKERERIDSLPLLSEEERRRVLVEWNDTAEEFAEEQCIHELFEAQVARTPDAVAVVYEEQELSYGELNRRANQLAHYLQELGVKPDGRVAIAVERGPEMMVGLLGVLKAGGAYVPLDPAYPRERLSYMLADSGAAVLLTQGHVRERFEEIRKEMSVLDLSEAPPEWADRAETNPDRASSGLNSQHLAYIIYTSGSTGTPKGVMIQHRGLTNLADDQRRVYGVKESDRISHIFSSSFDVSIFVVVMALSSGARLVLANQDEALPGPSMVGLLERQRITVATLPPSVLSQLSETDLPELWQVITGGDLWTEWVGERWSKGRKFFNSYGPTETTVQATVSEYRTGNGSPNIGRPMKNVRVHLLDGEGNPVPPGVKAEIYIGGEGLARGYVDNALSAERFVPDPFSENGGRLYRSGDLGRWLPDGNIELVGRKDEQVKIRGFRIELGEIRSRLEKHPAVREAAVIVREDTLGDKRLVAYYTCGETSAESSQKIAALLRAHLSGNLPEYMVPAAYVQLKSLPTTPNGKLDRKALPAPDDTAYMMRQYEAPQGKVEVAIAEVWAKLLKLEQVGRYDNFFDLGGHSFLILHAVSLLKHVGIETTVTDLFKNPTLESLAKRIGEKPTGSQEDAAVPIKETGSSRPLFLVHELTGSLIYAHSLARFVGSEIPVYGIPPAKLMNAQTNVPALASRMVGIMRAVQPVGPYRVAGWSFGGVFAYEIAAQILAQRQEVEFLGLFDTHCPDPDHLPQRPTNANLFLIAMLQSASGSDKFQQFEELKSAAADMKLEELVLICKERSLLPLRLAELPPEHIQRTIDHMRFLFRIYDGYAAPQISIPIQLFCHLDDDSDPTLYGWKTILPASLIRTIPAPGTHLTMMEPGNIELLGKALTVALESGHSKMSAEDLVGAA